MRLGHVAVISLLCSSQLEATSQGRNSIRTKIGCYVAVGVLGSGVYLWRSQSEEPSQSTAPDFQAENPAPSHNSPGIQSFDLSIEALSRVLTAGSYDEVMEVMPILYRILESSELVMDPSKLEETQLLGIKYAKSLVRLAEDGYPLEGFVSLVSFEESESGSERRYIVEVPGLSVSWSVRISTFWVKEESTNSLSKISNHRPQRMVMTVNEREPQD